MQCSIIASTSACQLGQLGQVGRGGWKICIYIFAKSLPPGIERTLLYSPSDSIKKAGQIFVCERFLKLLLFPKSIDFLPPYPCSWRYAISETSGSRESRKYNTSCKLAVGFSLAVLLQQNLLRPRQKW